MSTPADSAHVGVQDCNAATQPEGFYGWRLANGKELALEQLDNSSPLFPLGAQRQQPGAQSTRVPCQMQASLFPGNEASGSCGGLSMIDPYFVSGSAVR